jgi:hypothetical protein
LNLKVATVELPLSYLTRLRDPAAHKAVLCSENEWDWLRSDDFREDSRSRRLVVCATTLSRQQKAGHKKSRIGVKCWKFFKS